MKPCKLTNWPIGTHGYGQKNKGRLSHRVAYEKAYGPIPAGSFVLHHCDVRACIEPTHLYLGTQADNMADAVRRGRFAVGENHGQSKVSDQDREDIRTKYSSGKYTQEQLAAEYGLSQGRISRIIHNKYSRYQHALVRKLGL